jgi:hypothetical protein
MNSIKLSSDAEIMLMVIAANGGTMTKADLFAECERISLLSEPEQREWRKRIAPLVQAHAARALRGE